ncbi:hypothetical protein [Streptomyces parvulus]
MTAIYLPDSGSLPRWVAILVGWVVLVMAGLRSTCCGGPGDAVGGSGRV